MKYIISTFLLLISCFALSAQVFSLSNDLILSCSESPATSAYELDVADANFGNQDPASLFNTVSVDEYAVFTIEGETLTISIDADTNPVVATWTKAEWDNFCKIVSNRLRILTGNAPKRD